MDAYDNEGKFRVFQNQKTKDSQPDYKLLFTLDGEDYEIGLWKQVSKAGKQYLSGKLKPKTESETETFQVKPSADDGIPF